MAEDGDVRPAVHRLPDEVRRGQDGEQDRPVDQVPAAQQRPGGRRARRSRGRAPPTRKPMFHLASIPRPASPPTAIHQRGSERVRSLVTASSTKAQPTKSTGVVVSSCIAPRYSAQQAVASAASSWPPRPAPSARAIAAVSSTSAASPSAGSARRPTSVSPVSSASTRASSGVSDGWSTYPQARCCPAARKYSSSRSYPYRPLTAISTPKAAAATSQTALSSDRALDRAAECARIVGRSRGPRRHGCVHAASVGPADRRRFGRTDEPASPPCGR